MALLSKIVEQHLEAPMDVVQVHLTSQRLFAASKERVVRERSDALNAIKNLFQELLADPHGLTIMQVVATASGGGKRALEAVKEHLLELRADPYGLTTAQVLTIASNGAGKQALEAVKEHLLELRADPCGLTTAQVLVIASNGADKLALEAVKRHLLLAARRT